MEDIRKDTFFNFGRLCKKYVDILKIKNLERRIGLPNSTLKHAMCLDKSRSPKKWVPQTKEFFLCFFTDAYKLGLFTFDEIEQRIKDEEDRDL